MYSIRAAYNMRTCVLNGVVVIARAREIKLKKLMGGSVSRLGEYNSLYQYLPYLLYCHLPV